VTTVADVQRLVSLSDDAFGEALRDLGAVLDVPPTVVAPDGTDPARRARLRIEAGGATAGGGVLERLGFRRPVRRGLVLALAALLGLAAIAGAVGFGLPGLRIVFGPTPSPSASANPSVATASPSSSPSPAPTSSPRPTPSRTPGPPGSTLSLGRQVTLDEARGEVGFPLLLPTDARLGPPDAAWIDDVGRVTLVWTARPGVPATIDPNLALVVTEFPGRIDPGYFEKILRQGTSIESISVAGHDGYWISGSPHEFVYVDPSGEPTFDDRRLAGDTLAWSDGSVTYRIETDLGRDAAIAIAESMR
jgi:hypothetical protein